MSAKSDAKQKSVKAPKQKVNWKVYCKRYWQLYALLVLPMIYLLVFKYVPMKYILIAFKKYSITQCSGSSYRLPYSDHLRSYIERASF